MTLTVVGRSVPGQRIHAKGEAFRRRHEPPTPPRAPVPPPAPVAAPAELVRVARASAALPAPLPAPVQAPAPALNRVLHVVRVVAAYYRLTPDQLTGRCRILGFVRPRQIAMYLARETGASLPLIGRRIGYRDHTTILSGVRAVTARLKTDRATAEAVAELRWLLGGGP